MIEVAPRSESIQSRRRVPYMISVAQAAAFFGMGGKPQFVAGALPNIKYRIRRRVPRPWPAFCENLRSYFAGVSVFLASHLAGAGQSQHSGFARSVGFRSESPELAFRHRLVRHAI